MVEIQPIRVELEREEDGRFLASVPDLPGVMAYGSTPEEAIRKVKSIALQVLADMIESGEDVPGPLKAALPRGVCNGGSAWCAAGWPQFEAAYAEDDSVYEKLFIVHELPESN